MVQVMLWMVEEWAWNVFPSTKASSFAVVGVYTSVLAGVWWNWGEEEGMYGDGHGREPSIREDITIA
jgi:alpha-1,3-mannosyltransferase